MVEEGPLFAPVCRVGGIGRLDLSNGVASRLLRTERGLRVSGWKAVLQTAFLTAQGCERELEWKGRDRQEGAIQHAPCWKKAAVVRAERAGERSAGWRRSGGPSASRTQDSSLSSERGMFISLR